MFHVNVAGVFATIKAFYPLLKVRPQVVQFVRQLISHHCTTSWTFVCLLWIPAQFNVGVREAKFCMRRLQRRRHLFAAQ